MLSDTEAQHIHLASAQHPTLSADHVAGACYLCHTETPQTDNDEIKRKNADLTVTFVQFAAPSPKIQFIIHMMESRYRRHDLHFKTFHLPLSSFCIFLINI